MIRKYSRRVLLPFMGMVQIAETEQARALSMDGQYWSIQFRLPQDPQAATRPKPVDPGSTYTRIIGYHHASVGTIQQNRLEIRNVHPALDADAVHSVCEQLFAAITGATLPFPAADRYEYWLLDSRDERPLALIYSTVEEKDLERNPPRPEWHPMPASELKVVPPEPPQKVYVPPVNYRLGRLVEERGGYRPRGQWFERNHPGEGDFPPCLLREDWPNEKEQMLCERYLQRLAPRLLMLQGLPEAVRERLEQAAREHVFDIERFHSLYPQVINASLMTAARVEASLRRANA